MIAETVLALALLPATTAAQTPPGPPGPPPGNGTDLPSNPGTAPAYVPPGTAAAIPEPQGPGLLDRRPAVLNRAKRTFTLALACQADGRIKVRAERSTIARARYRCAQGRATVRLSTSARVAKRLEKQHRSAAAAIVSQAAKTSRLYFDLIAGRTHDRPPGFWTDGHLDCAQGYLVEPDFTAKSPIPISTRGWVAYYTAATGWHWLGNAGPDTGRWNTWTATPSGVAQFHPDQAIVPAPWTLGPIAVPTGRGLYAVGVYEIVYWVAGQAEYTWQYVNAGSTGAVAAGAANQYCAYP